MLGKERETYAALGAQPHQKGRAVHLAETNYTRERMNRNLQQSPLFEMDRDRFPIPVQPRALCGHVQRIQQRFNINPP